MSSVGFAFVSSRSHGERFDVRSIRRGQPRRNEYFRVDSRGSSKPLSQSTTVAVIFSTSAGVGRALAIKAVRIAVRR